MSSMNMSLGQSMRQEMKLSPRMYQSMEVLQMTVMDVHERLNQELEENPVLELTEPTVDEFDPVEPTEPTGDPGAKELTVDEYRRIFRALGPAPFWVTISGGEPFLRPDLAEIVDAICDESRPAIINIPTSGTVIVHGDSCGSTGPW